MTELLFGLLYLVLVGAFCLYVRETNKEKAKLLNALLAKSPEQFRDLEMTDKVAQIKVPKPEKADIIPLDQLTEEEFDQHISEQLQ